jgi:2-amino-4-hydroxy-6-hydroxymethyldihydropteridine diphosphokinase
VATPVGIALGSNLGSTLGNRLCNIKAARDMLGKLMPADAQLIQAPIYQSAPLDCPPGSPDFLNTVVEIRYAGLPHELLKQTQKIESSLGRDRIYQNNAPRPIDLDILYFGNESLDDEVLCIPHPEITRRRFVLEPLAAIRPDLVLHGESMTIAEHLQHLDSGEVPLTLMKVDW